MSLLTKWNPMNKGSEIDVWRPATRWDPLREMEEVMRGLQRTFAALPSRVEESMTLAEWSPSVDIVENENEFLVKAELPDVKKKDIQVNVEDGTLSITGERKVEKEEKTTKYHRVERSFGRFERSFSLPPDSDADKITSEYKDGILTVHLPKKPGTKSAAHNIPVS